MKDHDNDNAYAMYKRLSFYNRLCRKLGFGYHYVEVPEELAAKQEDWMITTITFRFTFGDRLRLLLTGKLRIDARQVRVGDDWTNAISYQIGFPFEDRSW